MAKKYDLSDLGASRQDLRGIGATQAITPETLPQEAGSIAEAAGKGIGEYALGAAHGFASPYVQLSHLINRGISKIPGAKEVLPEQVRGQYQLPQFGEGTAYESGKPLGTAASYVAGGEIADLLRGGLEAIPTIARGAEYLSKVPAISKLLTRAPQLARIVGTGAFGALTSPEDRLGGLERGMALASGAEMLPEVGAALTTIRPMLRAKKILQELGDGKTLNENSKGLARNIRDAYLRNKSAARMNYKPILDKVGKLEILPDRYNGIPKEDIESFTRGSKKAHIKFAQKPTFENAHALQSTLGKESTALGKTGLDIPSKQSQGAMMDARDLLQKDMHDFLNNYDNTGVLAANYKNASDFYKERVIPYIVKKKPGGPNFRNIATGVDTDPKNITEMFTRPEPEVQSIIDDMGPQTQNKILYSKLGKLQRNLTPERLLDAYDKFDEQGLRSHVPKSLDDQMNALRKGITRRNWAQRAGFAGLGAVASQHFGHFLPYLGEGESMGAAAVMGGALGPYITRRIGTRVPSLLEEETRKVGREHTYNMIRNALMAQLAKGGQ